MNKVTASVKLCFHLPLVQVLALLSHESAHKLLILAGQSVEESGELLFHRGLFSPHQLKQILTEQVQPFLPKPSDSILKKKSVMTFLSFMFWSDSDLNIL